MKKGVVAHLFRGQKIFLVRRTLTEFVDPGKWDSVSETLEEGEDFHIGMTRGLREEIGVVPHNLNLLGITRAGHGFFCGSITSEEFGLVRVCGREVDTFGLYDLKDLHQLELGGALKHHLEAYPEAFTRMAMEFTVSYNELRLKKVEPVFV